MMNIKDVLSPGEKVLFGTQQHRFVLGGKETSPGQIFVTTERVIIETSKWLGLKKDRVITSESPRMEEGRLTRWRK